ncbi:hypothetical protein FOMPIDRAFT_89671 [Fomitopsis schrenkii]|uniref:Uncharacterized protein n=1 Tax=Fomitopsis schrenkii TaxID=2126942 RepID=S8DZG7_FOMSC|nr:hypothetical protein FOMPIDRAFT_89671 [Fomitopsis schrenkii]
MKQPLFDSLQDANRRVVEPEARLTCDTVLTGEEVERRVRLILEPWDRRGILTVTGGSEITDEELLQKKSTHHPRSENKGSCEGVGASDEAQPSEGESVLVSDRDDEGGREGAVHDPIGVSEI